MAEDCPKEGCNFSTSKGERALKTHWGMKHDGPFPQDHSYEVPVGDVPGLEHRELYDIHPQSVTVGGVDLSQDPDSSWDHIRIVKWYESEDQNNVVEWRLQKWRHPNVFNPGWARDQFVNIPARSEYIDDIIDMFMDVQIEIEQEMGVI